MSEQYLPPVTHVASMVTIRRERTLPVPGSVTVRVNEKVQATHVVAEAEHRPQHFFLDLARGLGISERRVGDHLVCQQGDRVDAGEVIAGPVGLARRTVRAPADGRILTISRGRVLFEARGERLELRAGLPGKVVATDGIRVVTIETSGSLIQGVWGNGQQEFGVMRLVEDNPASRLQTGQLDINLRGAILVAGVCDHLAPLHQATEISVRGVILGGLASELIQTAKRLPYPLIVTEGFGHRPINTPAFNLMSSHDGREVALDARPALPFRNQRPEVIIPLQADRPLEVPEDVIPLKRGVRVRILRAPHQGEVGVIRKVLPSASTYPSGVRVISATVELDQGGTTMVPLANLDVLR